MAAPTSFASASKQSLPTRRRPHMEHTGRTANDRSGVNIGPLGPIRCAVIVADRRAAAVLASSAKELAGAPSALRARSGFRSHRRGRQDSPRPRTSPSRAEGRVHVLVTWRKQDLLDLVRPVLKPATRARRKEAQSAPARSPASALRQRPPALGRRACGLRSHSSSEPKCFQDWTQLVLAAVPINEALDGSGPVINPARGIIRERRSLKPTARKLIGGRRASLHNLS